ncbi:MAG: DUF4870 domain-containing protein [Ktedonobacteraceae bacterium]
MSWNPNQGQDPNPQGQYGGGYSPPPQGPNNPPPAGGQPNYQYNAYGQPGYQQQPYGAPPTGTGSPLGPSSIGMDPKIASGLGYLIGIIGLIFFFIEKKNRFVKFNALQAIFLHFGFGIVEFVVFIIYFALLIATNGSAVVGLFGCLLGLVGIAWFVGWLLAMIQAFQGKYFKFPLVGDWADKIVSKTPGLV